MKKKNIIILTAIMVVALIVSALTLNMNSSSVKIQDKETMMFPELVSAGDEIDQIKISSGDETVTIKKKEDNWVVENRHDWPANTEKVSKLLNGLLQAKKLEQKTSNPDLYERIGVGDNATLVSVSQADKALSDFYLGNRMYELDGTYVRGEDDSQSWLASGEFSAPVDVAQWLNQELLTIGKDRIRRISIKHSDGDAVSVWRETRDESDYTLDNIPEGRSIDSQYTVNDLASVLENLKLEDVSKDGEVEFTEDSKIETVIQTFDGLEVVITLAEVDGKNWASFKWAFKEDLYVPEETEKEVVEGDNMTPMPVGFHAKQETADLREKTDGWVFALSSYKYDQLTKRVEDLLEVPETD